LNSLAAGARTDASSEIDNSSNLDLVGKLELVVAFGSSPVAGTLVRVYMLTAPDGTNYEDGSSSVIPAVNKIIGAFPVKAQTAAQRLTIEPFQMEPGKTKFIVENATAQAFASSGNILTLYTSNREIQ